MTTYTYRDEEITIIDVGERCRAYFRDTFVECQSFSHALYYARSAIDNIIAAERAAAIVAALEPEVDG